MRQWKYMFCSTKEYVQKPRTHIDSFRFKPFEKKLHNNGQWKSFMSFWVYFGLKFTSWHNCGVSCSYWYSCVSTMVEREKKKKNSEREEYTKGKYTFQVPLVLQRGSPLFTSVITMICIIYMDSSHLGLNLFWAGMFIDNDIWNRLNKPDYASTKYLLEQ